MCARVCVTCMMHVCVCVSPLAACAACEFPGGMHACVFVFVCSRSVVLGLHLIHGMHACVCVLLLVLLACLLGTLAFAGAAWVRAGVSRCVCACV